MTTRRSMLAGLGAAALAGGASAEDRSGSTSASGFAGRSYATSGEKGALRLSDLAAMPKTAAPIEMSLKPTNTKFIKGHARVAVATYGLYLVRTGKATAYAGGFGSNVVGRRSTITTGLVGVGEDLANALADEAFADLRERLAKAGFEVMANDTLQASALSSLGALASGSRGLNGQPIYGPSAAPVRAGTMFTSALSGLGGQGTLTRATDETEAIILFPSLGIDYETLQSSGSRTFAANASVDASLRFHALPNSGATFYQKPPPPYRGAWPGSFALMQGAGTDEPFAIMYEIDDRSDSALVSTAMALAGLGNMYRQSKVYAVEAHPDRYAALVRAAYQGLNMALTAEMVKARG